MALICDQPNETNIRLSSRKKLSRLRSIATSIALCRIDAYHLLQAFVAVNSSAYSNNINDIDEDPRVTLALAIALKILERVLWGF